MLGLAQVVSAETRTFINCILEHCLCFFWLFNLCLPFMPVYVASRLHNAWPLSLLTLDNVVVSLSSNRNRPVAASLQSDTEQSAAFDRI